MPIHRGAIGGGEVGVARMPGIGCKIRVERPERDAR